MRARRARDESARIACVVLALFHAAASSPCGAAPPPAVPPCAAGGTEALVIGTRLELFVDDFLIERLRGAALALHPPVEREIALRFDAPWEGAQSAYGTVLRDGAELRMYYRGGGDLSREHACLATSADGVRWMRPELGLDGFVSVNAPHAGGELLTKPLVFAGDRLAINYATSAAGSVRVEIQDVAGAPLPGFALADCPEIYGDEIERIVAWTRGPDVGALAGRPVRLRFVMMDADLFALRFAPARP